MNADPGPVGGPTPDGGRPGQDSFPALDGLRAIGAYCVVITHTAFQTGMYPRGTGGAVLARFDAGVALFFVLSGFLMSLGFLRPLHDNRPLPSLRAYAIKRVLRIWPVFAVAAIAATLLIGRDTSFASWWHSLTFTHLYSRTFFTDGLTQMWSLETEVAFYAALPLLVLGLRLLMHGRWRPARIHAVLGLLVVVNWAWLVWWAGALQPHLPFVYQWLPSYLAWFAAGIALATIWVGAQSAVPSRVVGLLRQLAASPGALWGIAASVLLVVSTPLAGPLDLSAPTHAAAVVKNAAYTVVAVCVVMPAVFVTRRGRWYAVMTSTPVRYLGHISYGIFCIHLVVLSYAMRWTHTQVFGGHFVVVAAITIPVSTAVAAVLYRLVERPAMRLAQRLSRRSKPASTEAATPASAHH